MYTIPIKPLSVNQAWRGRRTKTQAYKDFERSLFFLLPDLDIPSEGPLELVYAFGFSSHGSDIDNAVKQCQDILSKKYNFNDNRIYKITAEKKIVNKGTEYIGFFIQPYFVKN